MQAESEEEGHGHVLVLARTQSTGWQAGCWIDDIVHVRYTDTDTD
jgi:hypothetical protein